MDRRTDSIPENIMFLAAYCW